MYGHPEGLFDATALLPSIDNNNNNGWVLIIKNRAAYQMVCAAFTQDIFCLALTLALTLAHPQLITGETQIWLVMHQIQVIGTH